MTSDATQRDFTTPRVVRKHRPERIRKSSYREDSFASLLKDFQRRCAYCMQREAEDEGFKIDHFWPTAKQGPWAEYDNLFLACDRCNQHKSDWWPTKEQRDMGARYLNCCKEADYGAHIFEKPNGEVDSDTPQGKYHILMLKLNRPDLVRLRARRAEVLREVAGSLKYSGPYSEFISKFAAIKSLIEDLVPPIPNPPAGFHYSTVAS